MRISLLGLGGLLALAVFAQPAAAQSFYKSTLPDGNVIYGDRPAPGAVKVEEIRPDTARTGTGPAATTPTPAASRDAALLKEMRDARLKREAADARVQAAERALRAAEAARAAGVEPLEGERIGFLRQAKSVATDTNTVVGTENVVTGTDVGTGTATATGPEFGSRLNDAYFERQKKLEQAVVEARRNLEKVRAGK